MTDGMATDPPGGFEAGLATLMGQPAGGLRCGWPIAIGRDAQVRRRSDRFIGDPSVPVLVADSTEDIADRLVAASLAVSRMSEVGADRSALARRLLGRHDDVHRPGSSTRTRSSDEPWHAAPMDGSRPRAARGRRAAWHIIGSARGAAHRAAACPTRTRRPVRTGRRRRRRSSSRSPTGTAIARHFRSAEGSALAVDVGCRVAARMAAVLTEQADGATASEPPEAAPSGGLRSGASCPGYRRGLACRRRRPHRRAALHGREQAALDAPATAPRFPTGRPCCVAMIAWRWLVCAQIGDGDMLGVRPDGRALVPGAGRRPARRPARPPACASRTRRHRSVSACTTCARCRWRRCLLATDGYGNAQAAEPWQPGVGRDLAELAAGRDNGWFDSRCPAGRERCASSEGSGDDTTIALLSGPQRGSRG